MAWIIFALWEGNLSFSAVKTYEQLSQQMVAECESEQNQSSSVKLYLGNYK